MREKERKRIELVVIDREGKRKKQSTIYFENDSTKMSAPE